MSETYTMTVEPLGRRSSAAEDQSILDACLRAESGCRTPAPTAPARTCKAAGARGRHRAQRRVGLRPDGLRAQRGQGAGVRGDARAPTSRSRRTSKSERGGRGPPGAGLHRHGRSRSRTSRGRPAGWSSTSTRRWRSTRASTSQSRHPRAHGVRPHLVDGQPAHRARRSSCTIRRTPGGLGTDGWVFRGLAAGDTVSGRRALRALLPARPDDERRAILIGGGTGLAPLKAMVRHVLENGL